MNMEKKKHINLLIKNQRKRKSLHKIVMCMAVLVVSITTYMLILPAITMTDETYCGQEHEHIQQCYANPQADIETAQDWELTLPADLTGNKADDLLAVAQSQLGYTESTANYIVENDITKGYTRYGQWCESPYIDWSAAFVAFCLEYAGIDESMLSRDLDCQQWVAELKGSDGKFATPQNYKHEAGDVVFFGNNGVANRVGIVADVRDDNSIEVIEGDSQDKVQYVSYSTDDSQIIGYGVIAGEITDSTVLENESTDDSDITEDVIVEPSANDKTFTYSDDNIDVAVVVPEACKIPKNTKLQVNMLDKGDKEFVENLSTAQLEKDEYILDYGQYSINLVSDNEIVEIEADEVNVKLTYKTDETVEDESVQATISELQEDEIVVLEQTELNSDSAVATTFASRLGGNYDVMLTAMAVANGPSAGNYGNFSFKYNDVKDAFVSQSEYSNYYHENSPLGVAGSFHIVGFGTVKINTHANGNILANTLISDRNFGTNNYDNELTYVQTYQSVPHISASKVNHILVVGSDNIVKVQGNQKDQMYINGTKIDSPHNIVQDVDTESAPFIDLDKVEAEIRGLSARLASEPNTGITLSMADENNRSVTLNTPDGAGFYNVTAKDLQKYSAWAERPLRMKGFQKGKNGTIIMNIDCTGVEKFYMPTATVFIDGVEQNTNETTEFSSGKVVWNFINAENTTIYTARMTGMIIAPGATVSVEQNLNGTIVAENVIINAESHRTDFTGDIEKPPGDVGPHVKVRKVDGDNISLYLNGAEYDLYKWNGSSYVLDKSDLKADDGESLILNNISYNVAYRLVETKAPQGYKLREEPYDFILISESGSQMKPNDFNGLELNNGQTIYYKNEKSFSFVINKQWLSSEGNPLEPPQSSVSVDVWRNIYTDEECTKKYSSELYKGGLTISADENWQLTLENLPASGQMNINDRNTDVYYTYYVKEDAIDGYGVSYSGNDGIVSGTVIITNTQLEGYILPDTGGIGKYGFMLAGVIIMFLAGTIIIKRKIMV